MKKEWKNILILVGLTAFLCCCCFLPNIISHIPLAYGTDIKPEQIFFIENFNELMNNFFATGTLPFYSWHLFLGNNYYASMSFYGNADLFNFIGLLLQSFNFFDRTLILEIIKLFVASLSMYGLLSIFNYKTPVKYIGSLCFAFSSWALFYSGQTMFLSWYCLLPLYFIGIEFYLRKNKLWPFFLAVLILLFTNWYFLYTISIFTPVYYLYRYYLLKDDFHSVVKDTLKIIGIYLLAIGVGCFYLYPTIEYMTGNNRVGGLVGLFTFEQFQIYFHELISAFVPNYMYIYKTNVLETGWHVTREMCIWATGLMGLLPLQAFFIKDPEAKKFKRASIIVYAIIAVIIVLPIGNSIMHGLSEPSFRWVMIIAYMNIITSCYLLNNLALINKKALKVSSIIIAILLIVMVPLTSGILQLPLSSYYVQLILFIICALIIVIYAFILNREFTNKLLIILICVVIEIGGFSSALFISSLDRTEHGSYEFNNQAIHVLQDDKNELNTYLNNLEPSNYNEYYRVFVDDSSLYWYYSNNMASIYQLNGLEQYSSTYAPSFNTMKDMFPQVMVDGSAMIYNIKDPQIMTFLSTKYALVTDESQLVTGINWELVDDSYRGFIKVYRNSDYTGVAHSYDKVKTIGQVNDSSDLLNYIICKDEDLDHINAYDKSGLVTLTDIYYGDNYFHGSLNTNGNSYMVLSIPYDEGWKVLIDNQEVQYEDVNGGFIGIYVPANATTLDMYFMPSGFKVGLIISGISTLIAIALFVFYTIKKRKSKLN